MTFMASTLANVAPPALVPNFPPSNTPRQRSVEAATELKVVRHSDHAVAVEIEVRLVIRGVGERRAEGEVVVHGNDSDVRVADHRHFLAGRIAEEAVEHERRGGHAVHARGAKRADGFQK